MNPPRMTTNSMAVVRTVSRKDSVRILRVIWPVTHAIKIAANAPTAAASVGLNQPR